MLNLVAFIYNNKYRCIINGQFSEVAYAIFAQKWFKNNLLNFDKKFQLI